MNRVCVACNKKIDASNYCKGRTVCKRCYSKIRRINDNNTIIQNQHQTSSENEISASHQQPTLYNVNNSNNNETLIMGFSNCGKTYLMK